MPYHPGGPWKQEATCGNANRCHLPALSLAWVYLAHGLGVATRSVRRVIS